MLCKLKHRYNLNKGHDDMATLNVGNVLNVSNYPLLESIGFDTDIYYGVAKMRAATLLGDIFLLST